MINCFMKLYLFCLNVSAMPEFLLSINMLLTEISGFLFQPLLQWWTQAPHLSMSIQGQLLNFVVMSNLKQCYKMSANKNYTKIRHNICLKTDLYFCKRTVLKVLCYQNIYSEKHGRNLHVHIFIGDNHGE